MEFSKTYGLTHIALAVKDVHRSVKFYADVFGTQTMYLQKGFAQITTPGTNDIIVFEETSQNDLGKSGGIAHFGFRLKNPKDIDEMAERVRKAGGSITDKGEFVPGEPYLFFKDPDGYEVEIWYELLPSG